MRRGMWLALFKLELMTLVFTATIYYCFKLRMAENGKFYSSHFYSTEPRMQCMLRQLQCNDRLSLSHDFYTKLHSPSSILMKDN